MRNICSLFKVLLTKVRMKMNKRPNNEIKKSLKDYHIDGVLSSITFTILYLYLTLLELVYQRKEWQEFNIYGYLQAGSFVYSLIALYITL